MFPFITYFQRLDKNEKSQKFKFVPKPLTCFYYSLAKRLAKVCIFYCTNNKEKYQ